MEKKDYSLRGWLLLLAVIVAVAALNFVPSAKVFGLTTKTVDILSELRPVEEADPEAGEAEYDASFALLKLEQELAEQNEQDSVKQLAPTRYEWIVRPDTIRATRKEIFSENLQIKPNDHFAPIEDFDTAKVSRFDRFINKLIDGDNVRVAFLGDSYIEGDILSVDFREKLQAMFGGRGVGFVPCTLPFAIHRTSVQRQATGFSSYGILKSGEAPATYRNRFFISGYLSTGGRGAVASWKSADVKPHLDSCSRARVFLTCRDTCNVELILNDTLKHNIGISGADYVRELYVEAPVNSLKMRVTSGNVLCYGASLEGDKGVIVDNYSIRGNSGYAIFGTGAATNCQFDKLLGYDLVILEYGLNAMQPGQRTFTKFQSKLCDMITYCERCFPNAAILVLGVSDRAVNGEGGWSSINSVKYMSPAQRAAAKSCGATFWPLGDVVMSYGGINGFVKNGWAASDHIHINFKGGARIADALVQAIQKRAYEVLLAREGREKDLSYPIEMLPYRAPNFGISENDLDRTLVPAPQAITTPLINTEK